VEEENEIGHTDTLHCALKAKQGRRRKKREKREKAL
jgi:hypothetical protein